jgi:hypothetical protein
MWQLKPFVLVISLVYLFYFRLLQKNKAFLGKYNIYKRLTAILFLNELYFSKIISILIRK